MAGAGEKHPVRVTIFHQNYSLLASGDPFELIDAANAVDELMVSIASQTTAADSTRIAVLACLHLADRLRQTERDLVVSQGKSGISGELRLSDWEPISAPPWHALAPEFPFRLRWKSRKTAAPALSPFFRNSSTFSTSCAASILLAITNIGLRAKLLAEALELYQQLFKVLDRVAPRLRHVHQVRQQMRAFDMAQKLNPQAMPQVRAFDDPGNICHHESCGNPASAPRLSSARAL